MIRHPVWTSLSHVDYQRAIAWSSALGLELGETVGMLAAAGLAAIEGGPRAVHSTVEKGVDDANAAGLGSAEGREVGETDTLSLGAGKNQPQANFQHVGNVRSGDSVAEGAP